MLIILPEHIKHYARLESGQVIFIEDYFGVDFVVKAWYYPYKQDNPYMYEWNKNGESLFNDEEKQIVSIIGKEYNNE